MGKTSKSKKSKASAKQANRQQYNLPLEDRSVASIEGGDPHVDQEPKFKNQRWSRVIQIGVTAASQICLPSLQEDWDELQQSPLPPRKTQSKPWRLLFDPDLLKE